jgi:ABC-type xylose transport system substrate-binding protein
MGEWRCRQDCWHIQGDKTIPAILLGPVAATKDNVKRTVIKDSFQNLEMI